MKDILFEIKEKPIIYKSGTSLSPIPHLHKEIELVFVEDGYVHAISDKKIFEAKSGEFFITFPNQLHYYENSATGKYHVIIFSPDILFGLKSVLYDNKPKSAILSGKISTPVTELIQKFINQSGEYRETVWAGILNQIMVYVLESSALKPRIKTDNSTLIEVLDFCEQNFSSDITLDTVSDALHLNKYHISHLLNQKLGIGFSSYINSLRINEACDLLSETDKKTSDISEEVGFGSIRSFNRAFMGIMNITPLKYRSQTKTQNKKTDELIIGQ